jgi:formamidopyrimidine-DNA glycosylase
MPELPEVEGARRLAERNVVGKTITAATIAEDESAWLVAGLSGCNAIVRCIGNCGLRPCCFFAEVIAGISHTDLEQALIGRTLKAAKRRGKQARCEVACACCQLPPLSLALLRAPLMPH